MQQLVETFYLAFKNLDAETMVSCYHDDIIFNDPAFGTLKGERAKNMWRMLCESQKGKNFIVDASDIVCSDDTGTAHWEAHYSFSKTGRKVHNIMKLNLNLKTERLLII